MHRRPSRGHRGIDSPNHGDNLPHFQTELLAQLFDNVAREAIYRAQKYTNTVGRLGLRPADPAGELTAFPKTPNLLVYR